MGCFVQAEDGIRNRLVTRVQACALPISPSPVAGLAPASVERSAAAARPQLEEVHHRGPPAAGVGARAGPQGEGSGRGGNSPDTQKKDRKAKKVRHNVPNMLVGVLETEMGLGKATD